MLTDSQRQRFRALQNEEENGTLSAAEQAELQAFVRLIEEQEVYRVSDDTNLTAAQIKAHANNLHELDRYVVKEPNAVKEGPR